MSHFYSPVTGELIDGGLREARKKNGYPSPTTVLQMIKGEGLLHYFRRQMFEAVATMPRQPGWTDDQYYEACVKSADEHSKSARTRGGDFHTLIQRFHQSRLGEAAPPVVPLQFLEQYDAYSRWYETYVDRTLACEACVIGQGYAGRLDHCALMKDGRVAVLDIKSQDVSKKRGRFNWYANWGVQLGAYSGALEQVQHVDVLVSIAVSSGAPPVALEAYYWPKPPAYYHGLFMGLLALWMEETQYFPQLTTATSQPIAPTQPIDTAQFEAGASQ